MIIFPMAGESRRFFDNGFSLPKYQLPLWRGTVFEYCIAGFQRFFKTESFIFIYRDSFDTRYFIEEIVKVNRVARVYFVEIDAVTRGQAETVYLGLSRLKFDETTPISIFNIDTLRMPWAPLANQSTSGGLIEVFHGEGEHWSFVLPNIETGLVEYVAEKRRISDLCSTGWYHFKSLSLFNYAYESYVNDSEKEELYVAPMYNKIIKNNLPVEYRLLDGNNFAFCGTPQEYRVLQTLDEPYALPGRLG
jgi:CTP:molybdopterin cytidylyltransferase MocA